MTEGHSVGLTSTASACKVLRWQVVDLENRLDEEISIQKVFSLTAPRVVCEMGGRSPGSWQVPAACLLSNRPRTE